MTTTSSGPGIFFGLNGIESRLFRRLLWAPAEVARFNAEAAKRSVDEIKRQVLQERKRRALK